MRADLHTHTSASDGLLSPTDLVDRAVGAGVTLLSLTDHDTLAAYRMLPSKLELELVCGVELSARWGALNVHIVGLRVDPHADAMLEVERRQQAAREARAEKIAERLAPLGCSDILDAARQQADGASLGRPHFATALVEAGVVPNVGEAFRRYLGQGKRGDVGHFWPSLEEIVSWIKAAGGIAVLAHPLHYRLTNARLRRLLAAFRAAGGDGMEVISGRQTDDQTRHLARLCRQYELLASCGSDFHRPTPHGADVGDVAPLPADLRPVWADW